MHNTEYGKIELEIKFNPRRSHNGQPVNHVNREQKALATIQLAEEMSLGDPSVATEKKGIMPPLARQSKAWEAQRFSTVQDLDSAAGSPVHINS